MAVPHSRAAGKRLRAENVLRLPCLCSRSCLPRGIQNVIHTLPQNHAPVKLNEKEIHFYYLSFSLEPSARAAPFPQSRALKLPSRAPQFPRLPRLPGVPDAEGRAPGNSSAPFAGILVFPFPRATPMQGIAACRRASHGRASHASPGSVQHPQLRFPRRVLFLSSSAARLRRAPSRAGKPHPGSTGAFFCSAKTVKRHHRRHALSAVLLPAHGAERPSSPLPSHRREACQKRRPVLTGRCELRILKQRTVTL